MAVINIPVQVPQDIIDKLSDAAAKLTAALAAVQEAQAAVAAIKQQFGL